MSLLIVPLLYPDLAGLLNFSHSFQHNFRVADKPRVGPRGGGGCKGLARVRSLRSNCSSECHPVAVVPIVARLRRCASERPQPDTFVIHAKQLRKASDHCVRVRLQSRRTIKEVLRRVVGGISDEGLWVDDEPGLAFRPENVACVQVGSQQKLYGFRAWQLHKETQTSRTSPASGHRSM